MALEQKKITIRLLFLQGGLWSPFFVPQSVDCHFGVTLGVAILGGGDSTGVRKWG